MDNQSHAGACIPDGMKIPIRDIDIWSSAYFRLKIVVPSIPAIRMDRAITATERRAREIRLVTSN